MRYLFIWCSVMMWSGLAAAQASGAHQTTVRIPNYIGIKIVSASGNIAPNAGVAFDYASNPTDYLAALQNGGATLPPTAVSDFADIQVVARGGFWTVNTSTQVVSGFDAASGITLSDIRVTRGSRSGLTPTGIFQTIWGNVSQSWTLSSSSRRIAWGLGNSVTWQSLGFNGLDYSLTIQGNEAPGEHRAIVRYTLAAP